MAILKDLKFYEGGGMDSDSSIETRAKNDYGLAYNVRVTGTQEYESGYLTNIESNQFLSASLAPGINRCIGSAGFEDLRIGLEFIYNSQGAHRLIELNYDTRQTTSIDIGVLNLNPQHYVDDIDILNQTFLVFNDAFNQPNYINYQRLKSGGYGTLSLNDFLLIKQQPPIPISASFNNDASRSVNLIDTKGWQFRSEYVGLDFEYTPFSTISPIYYPAQESTLEVGTDVTLNNNLILSIPNAYSNRNSQLIIAATYGGYNNWFIIKTIDSADLLALPSAIDVSTQIYEAYQPSTNTYQLAFYNDGLYQNIPVLQTDQLCDIVPLVTGSQAVLNGNELIYGDITVGYPRTATQVQLQAVNYNPNLTIPTPDYTPFYREVINPGQSGSGQGNNKRLVTIEFGGDVKEGDFVTIILVDIRNASATITYTFNPATFAQQDQTLGYIFSQAPLIPFSTSYVATDGNIAGINFVTPPYYTLQTAFVTLFNAGSGIFKSIGALKSNSSYQLSLAEYDHWGRPFPIRTDQTFVVKTNSYGQSHGQTPAINWNILTPTASVGAETYQWLLSPNNTHQTTLFMLAALLQYQNLWNAMTNSPTLTGGSGGGGVGAQVGWVYEVSAGGTQNLGSGAVSYLSGDFVVFNGISWDVIPRSYGDITNPTAYFFYFNSLAQFNAKNNTSVLTYGYTANDRATIHYSQAQGTTQPITWYDGSNPTTNPLIDVQVQSYDPSTYLLKVNKSSAINLTSTSGLNFMIEVYTPKQRLAEDATGTTLNEIAYFEIGTAYPVINGQYSQLHGTITQGDIYFKTRELGGSADPNTLYNTLVEDFNFSDFFPSAFPNFGRPRTYDDTLETTEQVANLVYSEEYILGSKINGLTRFYPANIYGEAGGQTSATYQRVKKMVQVNNILLVIQELNHGSVPVYINIIEDQAEQQNVAISEKILGNIRYTESKHIGIGSAKESFAFYQNVAYWIDSNRNEPIRWTVTGAEPISGKMSKYFKSVLVGAYATNLKVIGWYDIFNNEYVISIQQLGGIVTNFPFNAANWQYNAQYSVLPSNITIVSGPSHGSASVNSQGIATVTPNNGYVGTDNIQISFPVPAGGALTKNACLLWTAGVTTVQQFGFLPATGQPLNTEIFSNFITPIGNTVAVPITVTGGEYSINGGAFTSSPGIVNQFDTVQVENLSSASPNTMTSTILSIGTPPTTGEFDVTTIGFGNVAIVNQPYTRNNCPTGQSGTTVPVSVAANTYYASTQMAADAMAQADAQAQANASGTCLVNSTLATLLVDYQADTTADLCAYIKTTGLTESGLIVTSTLESPSGPLQLNDPTPANCYVLSSDKLSTGTPAWRFGFNLAYFISKYSGTLTSIVFEIRGRSGTAALIGGSYDARDISEGTFVRSGSAGATIIGVSGAVTVPGSFTSNIGNGANGTVGLTVGAPWATLTYFFPASPVTPNTVSIVTY